MNIIYKQNVFLFFFDPAVLEVHVSYKRLRQLISKKEI